jgi:endoglucanase
VAWHLYAGPAPAFVLSNSIFASVDSIVNGASNQGLGVLLDFHNFAAFMTDPAANRQKFYAIWSQVGAHYSNAPPTVAFELLNEPSDKATTSVMNQIYPEAIRQLRLSNPNRTLFLGPGQWDGLGELKIGSSTSLLLPDEDTNLIATVHCYDPYYFTHQGAEWALPDTATTGVLFPGPPSVPLRADSSISHSWVLDWFNLYNTRPTAANPSSPFAFHGLLPARTGRFTAAQVRRRIWLLRKIRCRLAREFLSRDTHGDGSTGPGLGDVGLESRLPLHQIWPA